MKSAFMTLALVASISVFSSAAMAGSSFDFEYPVDGPAPGSGIPQFDNQGAGVGVYPLVFDPPLPAPIATLELEILGLSHDNGGDLDIYLIDPFGTVTEIMTDRGVDWSIDNADLIFRDDASSGNAVPEGSQVVSGTYVPEGFASQTDAGLGTYTGSDGGTDAWILLIIDDAIGDTGSFSGWRLRGTVVPEPATLCLIGLGAVAALRRKRS